MLEGGGKGRQNIESMRKLETMQSQEWKERKEGNQLTWP
jgi:hypothetical protein